MNSIKCAECGLVNFASATECRRCHIKFHHPAPNVNASSSSEESSSFSEASSDLIEDRDHPVPPAPFPDYYDAEPAPFSWPVILFTITLGLHVVVFLCQLKVFYDFMGSSRYQIATNPGGLGPYEIPWLEPMMYAALISKSVEFMAALALIFLLAGKKWVFLKWIRIYLFATLLVQILEIVGGFFLRAAFASSKLYGPPSLLSEIVLGFGLALAVVSMFVSIIWLTYFEMSERVKRIFTN